MRLGRLVRVRDHLEVLSVVLDTELAASVTKRMIS